MDELLKMLLTGTHLNDDALSREVTVDEVNRFKVITDDMTNWLEQCGLEEDQVFMNLCCEIALTSSQMCVEFTHFGGVPIELDDQDDRKVLSSRPTSREYINGRAENSRQRRNKNIISSRN
jgi:hypothetical protein